MEWGFKPQAIQAIILICRLWVRYEPQQGIAQIAKPSCLQQGETSCISNLASGLMLGFAPHPQPTQRWCIFQAPVSGRQSTHMLLSSLS